MTPRVAVCLAVFNGMRWLKEQVASIQNQEGVTLEIFFSVDFSDDGSLEYVQSLMIAHDNMHCLPYGETFGSASQNFFRLMRELTPSDFDYYCLADQDDIWFEKKVITAIDKLKKNNLDGYSANVLAFWSDGTERLIFKSHKLTKNDHFFEAPGPGCTFVMTAALFSSLGSYLQQHEIETAPLKYHDWFIYAYAREAGYRWFIDSSPCMLYRQHADNAQGANIGFRHKLRRLKLLLNGHWFRQAELTSSMLSTIGSKNASELLKQLQGGRLGMLKLALNSCTYRRSTKEKWIFFVVCLLFVVRGYESLKNRMS